MLSWITLELSSIVVPVVTFHQITHDSWITKKLVNPKPIKAADGRTFRAVAKVILKLSCPNRDQKPTPLHWRTHTTHLIWHLHWCLCHVLTEPGFPYLLKVVLHYMKPEVEHYWMYSSSSRALHIMTLNSHTHTHIASSAVKQSRLVNFIDGWGNKSWGLWCMVDDGMVTGVNLDMSSKPEFVKPALKAKAIVSIFQRRARPSINLTVIKSWVMSGIQRLCSPLEGIVTTISTRTRAATRKLSTSWETSWRHSVTTGSMRLGESPKGCSYMNFRLRSRWWIYVEWVYWTPCKRWDSSTSHSSWLPFLQ